MRQQWPSSVSHGPGTEQRPVSLGSGHDQHPGGQNGPDGFYDAARSRSDERVARADVPSNSNYDGPVPFLRIVTRNDDPAPSILRDSTPPKLVLIDLQPDWTPDRSGDNIAKRLTRNWDHLFALEQDELPANLFTGMQADRKRPS